jgi:hypothetical protein
VLSSAQQPAQGRPRHLFLTARSNRVVTPSLDIFEMTECAGHNDRMHPASVQSLCAFHVASWIQPWLRDPNVRSTLFVACACQRSNGRPDVAQCQDQTQHSDWPALGQRKHAHAEKMTRRADPFSRRSAAQSQIDSREHPRRPDDDMTR